MSLTKPGTKACRRKNAGKKCCWQPTAWIKTGAQRPRHSPPKLFFHISPNRFLYHTWWEKDTFVGLLAGLEFITKRAGFSMQWISCFVRYFWSHFHCYSAPSSKKCPELFSPPQFCWCLKAIETWKCGLVDKLTTKKSYQVTTTASNTVQISWSVWQWCGLCHTQRVLLSFLSVLYDRES